MCVLFLRAYSDKIGGEGNVSYLWTYDLYGPYVMVLMRADPIRGQVVGGRALEIETFLGPGVEPLGECHLEPQKVGT